jgi:hypothetical protein
MYSQWENIEINFFLNWIIATHVGHVQIFEFLISERWSLLFGKFYAFHLIKSYKKEQHFSIMTGIFIKFDT